MLVHPSLRTPGGGNGVAAWFIEALKNEHEVTLLTWTPPDLEAVNRFFGTALRCSDFRLCVVPRLARRLARYSPTPLELLKEAYLLRLGRGMAARYDVVIATNNEADLGRRGIQYINFPRFEPRRPAVDLRWYHAFGPLVRAYRTVAVRATGFSFVRMKANLTLVNSDWMGARVRALHGIESHTVYPPAAGEFPEVAWPERENGFVCIGRIAPEKRVAEMIDVLGAVRRQGHDVHLHIVGTADDGAYAARVRQLARANQPWVSVEENLSRAELARLVARHRYGLHGMGEEHFGMAVAELVRGGCIVFVPGGGGQVEIVGGDDRLLYRTPDEAARQIVATLRDPDRQAALRAHLAARARLFSAERFVCRIQELVRTFSAA